MRGDSETWQEWMGGETPEGVTDEMIRTCCEMQREQGGGSAEEVSDAIAACMAWRDAWNDSPSR